MKLPQPSPEPAKIDRLVPGGQGIATLENGKKAFLWNALPGEVVNFDIVKSKSSYLEGVATKILKPSPVRIAPLDPCYLATSPWQIMDYDSELAAKSALISEMFRQNNLALPNPVAVLTDNQDFHYRNKMEYSLYWDREKSQIFPAFHARGSHAKIPIEKSSIERPELFKKALEIIAELNKNGEPARKYQSLLLRSNQSGEVSGGLF